MRINSPAEWARYCGARYALLLPHGTDALRVAIAAAIDHDGMEYGGEIIVPNLSFIASATTVLDRRFGVALVDVDPETYLLDPKRVEEAIIPGKTRAIMAVHLFGQPADMTALIDIAKRHSLVLIEDAAQAHGGNTRTRPRRFIGDAAGFSFQSSKNLSAGEGGAFTTNDPANLRACILFPQRRPCTPWRTALGPPLAWLQHAGQRVCRGDTAASVTEARSSADSDARRIFNDCVNTSQRFLA